MLLSEAGPDPPLTREESTRVVPRSFPNSEQSSNTNATKFVKDFLEGTVLKPYYRQGENGS